MPSDCGPLHVPPLNANACHSDLSSPFQNTSTVPLAVATGDGSDARAEPPPGPPSQRGPFQGPPGTNHALHSERSVPFQEDVDHAVGLPDRLRRAAQRAHAERLRRGERSARVQRVHVPERVVRALPEHVEHLRRAADGARVRAQRARAAPAEVDGGAGPRDPHLEPVVRAAPEHHRVVVRARRHLRPAQVRRRKLAPDVGRRVPQQRGVDGDDLAVDGRHLPRRRNLGGAGDRPGRLLARRRPRRGGADRQRADHLPARERRGAGQQLQQCSIRGRARIKHADESRKIASARASGCDTIGR